MKKFVLAAAAASLLLAVPTFANATTLKSDRLQVAQADVVVKVRPGHTVTRKKVIVRHDRGLHRGWRHSRHYGATRTKVVIKRGPNRTVIRKIERPASMRAY